MMCLPAYVLMLGSETVTAYRGAKGASQKKRKNFFSMFGVQVCHRYDIHYAINLNKMKKCSFFGNMFCSNWTMLNLAHSPFKSRKIQHHNVLANQEF